MKALGTKSLSTIVSMVIQIVWWIEWIAAISITAAIIIIPLFKRSVSFNTPVTFSATIIKDVAATAADQPAGQLHATEGSFSFDVPSNLANGLIMGIVVAAAFCFIILITYQLKLIFSSFGKNDPFVEFNAKRIRKIGFILITYVLAQLLYNIALNYYLIAHFKWESGMQPTYSINVGTLFTGLTMIIIAEIFRQATELDNEQKLTV